MKVKLTSITEPSIEGVKSAEDIIVYCARVSNPKNQMNTESSPKLIKYLIEHSHWSPFELANMCVEIETSRAIAQQILRHRSFSFQEFSQRYSEATEFEDVQLRKRAKKNRQSSEEEINPNLSADCSNIPASVGVRDVFLRCEKLYKELLKMGVAKECARMVLPLSTKTTLYMNGSVRSWIHYIKLRSEENTQKEHREIAEAIKDIFVENFPSTSKALEWK